jgi:DNA uptake protein ComE-like DNA-binding protein
MNRSDRKIATAAIVVATLAFIALYFFGSDDGQTTSSADSIQSVRDTSAARWAQASRHTPYQVENDRPAERFPFDPNTADSTQLLRLGLQPWQVRNIYKYRSRGGIYRRKEDFARLYGLTVKQYRELEPYIHISSDYLPASTLVDKHQQHDSSHSVRDTLRYPVKIKPGEHIELNTTDTAQLMKVPGIGTYYAREIVRHGRRLGGYVSIDQLDEIENFPANAKQYFTLHANPQKLNVNKLTLQQLRQHPYINYYQAKAIVDYRRLHGKLNSLNDLRLSSDFPPEAIRRLEPYVEY